MCATALTTPIEASLKRHQTMSNPCYFGVRRRVLLTHSKQIDLRVVRFDLHF
jgi:hypothetical protein